MEFWKCLKSDFWAISYLGVVVFDLRLHMPKCPNGIRERPTVGGR